MKTLIAGAFALLTATAAVAQTSHDHGDMPMARGTITKIDSQWNRLTIDHGPLETLDMGAMKMVFEVADPAMMEGLSEGQEVDFVADRVKGKLTVTDIVTE
ncbi:copper-binding protein [Pseudooceanicola nanhaiensis]|uniref:copper-binding protein n=1 Tax=Pseudooceanicola nanhaiensis TaxID=375761 RepID=UPI001CD26E8E|nr:copper-binding protein [Pseudooceanicola nanhaiensis]MCA0920663.1 copper-binding protein [Pseudooceanicola nanhaiensis]